MIEKRMLVSAALICLAALLPGISSSQPVVVARVERVVNGCTLLLSNGEMVRYIGVEVEEGTDIGSAAVNINRDLLAGADVRLEFDVSMRDRQGRLLAYVYVGDLMVNEVLLKMGYAKVETYSPNTRYLTRFLKLQTEASRLGRGMWAKYSTSSSATSEPEVIVQPSVGGAGAEFTPEEAFIPLGQESGTSSEGVEIVGPAGGPVTIEGY